MRLVLDANLFVAIVVDEDESDRARRLLNADHEFYASMFTVMEVRHVLARQYQIERDRIEAIEETIRHHASTVAHGSPLIQAADDIQRETYVTTMDAIMLASAAHVGGSLVTFDGELHGHGAIAPADVL